MSELPLSCVVDASIAIKLFLPEAFTPEVQAYFLRLADDAIACAPDLLPVECSNILWRQVRFYGYDPSQAQRDQLDLLALAIQWTPTSTLLPRALEISVSHSITVYDACYVALSEQTGAPLLTADHKLRDKLRGQSFQIMTVNALWSTTR